MPQKWTTFISLSLSLSLSLSTNNASPRLKLYQKFPPKSFYKLSKHWKVISFRTAADTAHVHVTVARIGRPSKQLGCLHFYTLQVVYNSQLLVFYSTQSPTTIYGYATNWNLTSWEEICPQQSKFSVNFWRAMSLCHQDNVMIKDHNTCYTNAKYVWDN